MEDARFNYVQVAPSSASLPSVARWRLYRIQLLFAMTSSIRSFHSALYIKP